MSSVELRALEAYQKDISARFKAADDIVNGEWTVELIEVQERIRDILNLRSNDPFDAELLTALFDQEKQLKKREQEAFRLSVSGEWVGLSLELDEVNRAIRMKKWIRCLGHEV